MPPQILWFRQDLRLADQPALAAALDAGPVLPIYILDDETPPPDRRLGGASRWWLHHSLAALDAGLRARGSRLTLRKGRAATVLARLSEELGAPIHANHHYEPWHREAEAELAPRLHLHHGITLAPPDSVRSGTGTRYRIFTPFSRTLGAQLPPAEPTGARERIPTAPEIPSDDLATWNLLPTHPDWSTGFGGTPGESGALSTLEAFAPTAHAYGTARNLPAQPGTSRLSPHLHWGEISPARVWHAAHAAHGEAAAAFTRQILWRDFAINLLDQFPQSHATPHRAAFERFPHRDAPEDLRAWQRGRTGYPIVDAGMRQLWRTGWMHNRVRMIAASFLAKHLLIDWREGERFFWDTLVDADLANNTLGWQWIMGSGVDSSPFGRIIAPTTQSEKWDTAAYIREHVPELAKLPDAAIHDPSSAPPATLRAAGITLGRTYPHPIVGHAQARARAIAAYSDARSGATEPAG